MLTLSKLYHIFAIYLMVSLVESQNHLSREQDQRKVKLQGELIQQRIDNLQSQFNNMNIQIISGFNAKAQALIQLQNQATKKMEQLQEMGKEIHSWSEILKVINQYVTKGNNVLVGFNDKIATMMTKMVGFEQQMKAIVSLDTLVVYEGYQPVSDSTRLSVGEMQSSGTLGEHEVTQ